TATYSVTQADLDGGSVVNTAVGHGSFNSSAVDSTQTSATVKAIQNPKLSIAKTAAETSYIAVGDVLHYSYTLTNTGNVTLSGPFTVSDNKTTVTCPATTTLAPGSSITCTATYSATQADLDGGSVVNTATGHATFNSSAV